jgi:hypothetical protein
MNRFQILLIQNFEIFLQQIFPNFFHLVFIYFEKVYYFYFFINKLIVELIIKNFLFYFHLVLISKRLEKSIIGKFKTQTEEENKMKFINVGSMHGKSKIIL